MFYNDHGLNFFLDKMPTFAVGAAPEYNNADEGWGIPTLTPFKGDQDLSWHLIRTLVGDEFDIVIPFSNNCARDAAANAAQPVNPNPNSHSVHPSPRMGHTLSKGAI